MRILAIVMAGGRGTRLYPLTKYRSKPAVHFGGKYRIIDFVLSNLVNSGIHSVYVLTQFKSQSLNEHLSEGWQFGSILRDYFVTPVPAQMQVNGSWYRGNADAVFQNLHLIESFNPDLVAIFSADHVYRMDVRRMVDFHISRNADLTVVALPVPLDEASNFGIMEVDSRWKMVKFEEKPKHPTPIPGEPGLALSSLGNYIINTQVIVEELKLDSTLDSEHDFGRSIIPSMIGRRDIHVYDFRKNRIPAPAKGEEHSYWRDIGTIKSYYEANMELKMVDPHFNLYNQAWPIKTAPSGFPPAKFIFDEEGRRGIAINSLVSEGCIVSGGYVRDSILGRNVFIHSYARVEESIIFHHVDVGRHCQIRRAIVDSMVRIPPGTRVGYDLDEDSKRFHVSEDGTVVIPRQYNDW
ncbi:MAG: glucose-1-phosphate adenylyltransferase [Candidatus Glassbacteria bacterium]